MSRLIELDGTDLDVERATLFVREGKGKKGRAVPIGERAIRWTERYLDHVRPQLIEQSARRSVRNRSTHALFLIAHQAQARETDRPPA